MLLRFVEYFSQRALIALFSGLLLLWIVPPLCYCQWQPSSILCNSGSGNFDAEFPTNVAVHIGATRDSGLARRTCGATLTWGTQSLAVATGAAQVDLDVFGADFGDGIPVAAFQIKQADSDCCVKYAIYSLQKPPRLLRTITGGQFFSASDIDLDGKVEIFTDDAAAFQDFDKLTLGELDFPPALVLRFANSRLQDVSADFQPYFDRRISDLRAAISSHEVEELKNSDRTPATMTAATSAQDLHRLRTVKIKVLEIVWSYLYSGREKEAWMALAAMWPPHDVDRTRALLLTCRARGLHGQVESTLAFPSKSRKRRAQIFDAINLSESGGALQVVPPRAILLQRPPVLEQQRDREVLLKLVVDQAGKVRSVEPAGSAKNINAELVNAAMSWKFIPASREGRAVSSRFRLAVSDKQ